MQPANIPTFYEPSSRREYKILSENPYDFTIIKPYIGQRDRLFDVDDKIVFAATHPTLGEIIFKIDTEEEQDLDQIVHEAFIGIKGLNTLNSPYFAKVLGVYLSQNCPADLETIDEKCNYVVYEYIPGLTLLDSLETVNPDEFKEILLQILIGLRDAYNRLEFTHYDLHLKNIIVNMNDPHRVTYGDSSRDVRFDSKFLPVIIDYGSSHIKLKGIDYGRDYDYGQIYNTKFWAHDVFKLLSMIYAHTRYSVVVDTINQYINDRFDNPPGDASLMGYNTDEYIDSLKEDINALNETAKELRTTVRQGNSTLEMVEELKEVTESLTKSRQELKEVKSYKRNLLQSGKNSLAKADARKDVNNQIADIVEQLLKFFDPDFNAQAHTEYREKHPYFELELTEENQNLSFDDFMDYAIPILMKPSP